MDFNNFIKKLGLNKDILMGLVLAILTSLVFVNNSLNSLMENGYLGRIFIIVLLVLWTCVNKYLGLAFVLILVYFLIYGNNIMENFDNPESGEKIMDTKEEEDKNKINVVTKASVESDKNTSGKPTETTETTEEIVETPKPQETVNMATEGFDLLSTENTIKRGKQSNSIPVDQLLKQASNDEISPYEDTEFSEGFSIL
jgi:Na+-transporting methylmalonyl-CoA/oxaloacetate decarboxylase gamma subunit